MGSEVMKSSGLLFQSTRAQTSLKIYENRHKFPFLPLHSAPSLLPLNITSTNSAQHLPSPPHAHRPVQKQGAGYPHPSCKLASSGKAELYNSVLLGPINTTGNREAQTKWPQPNELIYALPLMSDTCSNRHGRAERTSAESTGR